MGPVMVVVEPRFQAAVWVSRALFAPAMAEVEPFLFPCADSGPDVSLPLRPGQSLSIRARFYFVTWALPSGLDKRFVELNRDIFLHFRRSTLRTSGHGRSLADYSRATLSFAVRNELNCKKIGRRGIQN